MVDLFSGLIEQNKQIPLAELLRPKTLDEFLGQSNVVAPNSPLLNLLHPNTMVLSLFSADNYQEMHPTKRMYYWT